MPEKAKDRRELFSAFAVLRDRREQRVAAAPSSENQLAREGRIFLSLEGQIGFGWNLIPF